MFNNSALREVVVTGLSQYLGVPVIRSSQNAPPPKYPYASYTVTVLENTKSGTWGRYPDNIDRIPITQTWSITVQSDKEAESVELAIKAKEWLTHSGTTYLNDNDVIVQSATSITNRDNMISIEYEYRNGFDVVFWLMNEVNNHEIENNEIIETVIVKEEQYG